MNVESAFLQAIREAPDDDAPRLVYADWLTDHGDDLGRARAELIRVQCQLARLAPDDPGRAALSERETALLDAHTIDWTDLAFADWLGHRKRDCRNPKGHEFCKLVRQGIRTRCERDSLPEDDPRREKLYAKLTALGQRMDSEFDYLAHTCDMSLFDTAVFRRGFIEAAVIQDWAINLFAEALPVLTVLRELEIENDSLVDDGGDLALERLVSVLDRLSLASLDCHSNVDALETIELLTATPAVCRLAKLMLWFDSGETGDECVALLAASPYLTGLRELVLEHGEVFTDKAFLAILDSPRLADLERCWLRPNNAHMPLSESVVRRFAERFGTRVEEDATIVPDPVSS